MARRLNQALTVIRRSLTALDVAIASIMRVSVVPIVVLENRGHLAS